MGAGGLGGGWRSGGASLVVKCGDECVWLCGCGWECVGGGGVRGWGKLGKPHWKRALLRFVRRPRTRAVLIPHRAFTDTHARPLCDGRAAAAAAAAGTQEVSLPPPRPPPSPPHARLPPASGPRATDGPPPPRGPQRRRCPTHMHALFLTPPPVTHARLPACPPSPSRCHRPTAAARNAGGVPHA